jgi:hypothetical protein
LSNGLPQKEESEFGKGLIVCLVKFSEHLMNSQMQRIGSVEHWLKNKDRQDRYGSDYNSDIEQFKRVELKIYGEYKKAFSKLIESWANGATDHLYDMQVPTEWENTELAKKVAELKDLGLTMGHSFTETLWDIEDIKKLRRIVTEISLELDKRIGIKDGDWGQF